MLESMSNHPEPGRGTLFLHERSALLHLTRYPEHIMAKQDEKPPTDGAPVTTVRLQNIAQSYGQSAALMAAVEVGVFTAISNGAGTYDEVARAVDIHLTNAERPMVMLCARPPAGENAGPSPECRSDLFREFINGQAKEGNARLRNQNRLVYSIYSVKRCGCVLGRDREMARNEVLLSYTFHLGLLSRANRLCAETARSKPTAGRRIEWRRQLALDSRPRALLHSRIRRWDRGN